MLLFYLDSCPQGSAQATRPEPIHVDGRKERGECTTNLVSMSCDTGLEAPQVRSKLPANESMVYLGVASGAALEAARPPNLNSTSQCFSRVAEPRREFLMT